MSTRSCFPTKVKKTLIGSSINLPFAEISVYDFVLGFLLSYREWLFVAFVGLALIRKWMKGRDQDYCRINFVIGFYKQGTHSPT
jgi:hypothetical protein